MGDIKRLVPRIVDSHGGTELFTMAHLITSIPCPLDRIDAVAVMPGLGEHRRIISAVRAWEENMQTRHFLVTGTNDIEEHQEQPTLPFLQRDPFNLKRIDGVDTQVNAEHTKDQADWLINRILSLEIRSVALFVSHWHLPRAYSTLVKTMLDRQEQVRVPIFPVAVPAAPYEKIPETGATVVEMSAGEAERIRKYQALGHVASLKELGDYIQWLWGQGTVPIR